MNASIVKAKLLAMRAELDALIERVDDGDESTPSKWMSVKAYAKHCGVHPDTVRKSMLDKGMPHTTNPIRIDSEEADQWRRNQ